MNDKIRVCVVDYGRKSLYMRYVDPLSGQQVARSTGTQDRKEANRVAAKWEHDLREGRYKAASKVTWQEFRWRFENEKLSGLSDNYAQVMHAMMSHFERLGIKRLARIDASAISHFQAMLRASGISESTIRCYLKHLRASLSWAQKIGLLVELPKITMPKRGRKNGKMRGRPISGEEFERMLQKTPTIVGEQFAEEWQHYLVGLWLSGLRLRESLRLSWDDSSPFAVDLSGKRPRFRILAEGHKRHQDELLPMTPDFAEWILETPENRRDGPAFRLHGKNGCLVGADAVGRTVSAIGKAAGIVVDKTARKFATAHDLRRSFGTRWSKRLKPATLQKLMRHADIKTTMDYYVDQDADEIAAELWEQHTRGCGFGSLPISGNTSGNTSHSPIPKENPHGDATPMRVNTSETAQ